MSLHHSFHLRLFVLLASILVIWVLAVIGSATDFFRREYHNNSDVQETFESSYSGTALNDDVSQYWYNTSGTQKHLIKTLHTYLTGSFALLQSNVNVFDVWVLPLKDDVLKKMYGGPSPAADSSNSASKANIDHVDVIASVVPAVQFVYNAKFTCASLNQTRRAYESSKIRVFDAYYNVCSTCFRAIIFPMAANTTTIQIQKGPVANAIYLLRPFALRINSSFSCRVKNIRNDPTESDKGNLIVDIDEISTIGTSGSTPSPGGNSAGSSASIVVYYLDYVEPIMDVIKKMPEKKSQFKSTVDVTNQTLTVSAPTSTYTISFSVHKDSTTSTSSSTIFQYPGIINAAKLAKQFSSSKYNNASSTQIRPVTQWNNNTKFPDVDLATMFKHQTPDASGCVLAETETSSVWPRAPGSPKCFQSDVTLNHAM